MLGNPNRTRQKEAIVALQAAMKSGDENAGKQAWEQFHESVVESVKNDYEMAAGDRAALAQRGYRQLTGAETEFYQKLITAGKAADPRQEFTSLISTNGAMPETIIEDVFRELTQEHALLSKINFQDVKYLTRWILNDHTKQTAVWGPINGEITKKLESSFREVSLTLYKLTAYTVIPKDMLDLGPTFLDNYIRTILKESIAISLEKAIVDGNGLNCPIGLDRNIGKSTSMNPSSGYAKKTAVKLKSFEPKEYGNVISQLVETENGGMRNFTSVTLICNMKDYLQKIMPATTVLNAAGAYTKDIFPFPTEVVISNEVETGEAILCLPEEYFLGLGGNKEGVIEYDDSYKFIEDQRTYKIKLHGTGKAWDNTVAVLLDISKLDPAYITVRNETVTA
ncbi:phage major capsid protein [Eubacterium ramulus]|uniref:phage major capsid protein n=1 Tax=Eubacterium ramulus TaxID=39490 RepID=UPI000D65B674|nr:phage major capsid protein [Eubacterium ramulus]